MNGKSKGREHLYEIVACKNFNDKWCKAYTIIIIIMSVVSIFPLFVVNDNYFFRGIQIMTIIVFGTDYVLKLITADFKLKKGKLSFLLYPVTPIAIIDIITLLPSIMVIRNGYRMFEFLRLYRIFMLFRVLKLFRYSTDNLVKVFRNKRGELLIVLCVSLIFIVVIALLALNIEPETFDNDFFVAFYWAVEAMSTIGFGEIYMVTVGGRIITIIAAFVGVSVIALPAGIIAGGFMQLAEEKATKRKKLKNLNEDDEAENEPAKVENEPAEVEDKPEEVKDEPAENTVKNTKDK